MSLARHEAYIGPEEPEEPPMTYRTKVWGVPTVFIYHGGSYVTVVALGEAVFALDAWEWEQDRPAILTEVELVSACREWMRGVDQHEWLSSYLSGLVPCRCRKCKHRRRTQRLRRRKA